MIISSRTPEGDAYPWPPRDADGFDMGQVALLVEKTMREEDGDDPTLEYYQQIYGK